jgi:hypothetical protein
VPLQADCLLCGLPIDEPYFEGADPQVFACQRHDPHDFNPYSHDNYQTCFAQLASGLLGSRVAQIRFTTGVRFALVLDLDDGRVVEVIDAQDPLLFVFSAELITTRDVRGFLVVDDTNARTIRGPLFDRREPKGLDLLLGEVRERSTIVGVRDVPSPDDPQYSRALQLDFERTRFTVSGTGLGPAQGTDDVRTDLRIRWSALQG